MSPAKPIEPFGSLPQFGKFKLNFKHCDKAEVD